MRQAAVILIDLPGLLGEIVRDLVDGAPGLWIAGEYPIGVEPVDAVTETGADFVIMSAKPGWEREIGSLMRRHPRVRTLGLAADGRMGTVYELRPHARRLGELSPEVLLGAIRAEPNWTPAQQGS